MKDVILSIDQGTTGTTAVLIDANDFKFIGKYAQEFPQIFPKPSWVEHNLDDIWNSVKNTVQGVLEQHKISTNKIRSIGLTNQRETTCAFNNKGLPLHNAIVWQDRRTATFCDKKKKHEAVFKKKTGLPLDPYFSGTKINWLLNNSKEVQQAYTNNELKFGTIDTFLLFKLTSGNSYFTEATNASRTLLMNLESCEWDQELLEILEISKDNLPEIKDSWCEFGATKNLDFLPDEIPITGILGDQQAALFGQAGYKKGDMKCTYGTGAFMLLNTGDNIQYSNNGLLTTVAYKSDGKKVYALEGASYIAGAAVQWMRDNLEIIPKSSESEILSLEVKNLQEMEHLIFMPFFTGLGSPYWISEAKAAILGITRDTKKSHLMRACLDGICLSINDLILAMKKDTKLKIKEIKVDGGAVENNLLCKIQATISEINIIRPKIIETTAYGAALASALGTKSITLEQIDHLWEQDFIFKIQEEELEFYKNKIVQWNNVIRKIFLDT